MDPLEFLTLAGRLKDSALEAERRTSIGRSYYGLYNALQSALTKAGKSFPGDAEDHEALRHYFVRAPDKETSTLGGIIGSLRLQRNEADYRMDMDINADASRFAHHRAARVLRRFTERRDAIMQSIQAVPRYQSHRIRQS